MNYYKFINGTRSSDYELLIKLDCIERLIKKNSNNLLCGIFSAIIAQKSLEYLPCFHKTSTIIFIILMLAMYFFLSIMFNVIGRFGRFIKSLIYKANVSDTDEIILKKYLYEKLANEVVYGISLVNKAKKIQTSNEIEKEELIYIYLLQAEHSFGNTYEMIYEVLLNKTNVQIKKYINSTGKDVWYWICVNAISQLKIIENMDERINVRLQIEQWENVKEIIKDIVL